MLLRRHDTGVVPRQDRGALPHLEIGEGGAGALPSGNKRNLGGSGDIRSPVTMVTQWNGTESSQMIKATTTPLKTVELQAHFPLVHESATSLDAITVIQEHQN